MKQIILFSALLAAFLPAYGQFNDYERGSQDQGMRTLMGQNNAVGAYGALTMQFTRVDDRDAFIFGMKGGLITGHMISMGLTASVLFNDVHYDSEMGADVSLAGAYGGFFVEPILMPNMPVHVAIPVTIGVGGASLLRLNDDEWGTNFDSGVTDAFMIIEPGVELEFNVTRFFPF